MIISPNEFFESASHPLIFKNATYPKMSSERPAVTKLIKYDPQSIRGVFYKAIAAVIKLRQWPSSSRQRASIDFCLFFFHQEHVRSANIMPGARRPLPRSLQSRGLIIQARAPIGRLLHRPMSFIRPTDTKLTRQISG